MAEIEKLTIKMELILHRACGTESNVTFTQIHCDIGRIGRVTMVWDAFWAWLEVNKGASLTYFLPHAIDLTVAQMAAQRQDEKRAQRNLPARVTFDGPEDGKIFMTTYGDWILKHGRLSASLERQFFVLDMGFGVYTADMVVAAAKLLHSLQDIVNSDTGDQKVSWLAISSEAKQTLFEERIFTTALGWKRAPKVSNEIIHGGESAVCKSHTSDIDTWLGPRSDSGTVETAVDVILDRLRDAKERQVLQVAFACIMSYAEANELVRHLRGSCRPTLIFLETWTDATDLKKAMVVKEVGESPQVSLILIHHDVSLVPPIHNLTDVIVAPTMDGMAFDHSFKDMVATRVMSDRGLHLAKSLRKVGSDVGPIVHTWPNCGAEAVCLLREACTSPAFDRELAYLNFSLVNAFPGMNPHEHYPVRLARDAEMLMHCGKLLGTGPLVETGNTLETCTRLYIKSPLALRMAEFVCLETNFHALRLFATVTTEQPWYINRILIQMAVLMSLGTSSILKGSLELSAKDKIAIFKDVGDDAVQDLGYKGDIWVSLLALRMYTKVRRDLLDASMGKGKTTSQSRCLKLIRPDAGNEALHRVSQWSERLSVATAGEEPKRLSRSELKWIDQQLSSTMSHLWIPSQVEGYFARHMSSLVVFQKEELHGNVDWDRIRRRTRGRPVMAACSRVERVVDPSRPLSPVYHAKEVVASPYRLK